jgi:kinesin family member C2/C3
LINAAVRRNEAANWLRRTVGVVCAKDLAEEPSEEEFWVGLRNGIILCNAVNKIQPGTVPKVAFVPFKSLKISSFLLVILHADRV